MTAQTPKDLAERIIEEVNRFALGGHISELGITGEAMEAIRVIAQASQARTDGEAVAEWVNEEQGFQALIPTAQIPDCTLLYAAPQQAAEAQAWRPMKDAPRDRRILAVVDGTVRIVRYGKTSHISAYGFNLADQGVEDFDLCDPECWQEMPAAPDSAFRAAEAGE